MTINFWTAQYSIFVVKVPLLNPNQLTIIFPPTKNKWCVSSATWRTRTSAQLTSPAFRSRTSASRGSRTWKSAGSQTRTAWRDSSRSRWFDRMWTARVSSSLSCFRCTSALRRRRTGSGLSHTSTAMATSMSGSLLIRCRSSDLTLLPPTSNSSLFPVSFSLLFLLAFGDDRLFDYHKLRPSLGPMLTAKQCVHVCVYILAQAFVQIKLKIARSPWFSSFC